LSVVLNKGILANAYESEEKMRKTIGCYVIHKTDKDNYAFILYDAKKNAIAKSCFKYASISETKEAIELCRKNGNIAAVEDRTKSWIEFVNHPKFELVNKDGKYSFTMSLINETVIIKSETFDDYEQCRKTMESAISAVRSEKLYFAENDVLSDGQFEGQKISEKPVEEAAKPVESVKPIEQPVKAVEEIAVTNDKESGDNAVETGEITLKDGLEIAAATTRKEKITKKYIADYLNAKFGKEVETNCRANYIKSGKLPLADTHYVLAEEKKICFAFVYEINDTVMMLLKVSKKLGNKFAKGHNTVNLSAFPKSKDSWYSIIVDDSFTNEDVETILNESFLQIKEN